MVLVDDLPQPNKHDVLPEHPEPSVSSDAEWIALDPETESKIRKSPFSNSGIAEVSGYPHTYQYKTVLDEADAKHVQQVKEFVALLFGDTNITNPKNIQVDYVERDSLGEFEILIRWS